MPGKPAQKQAKKKPQARKNRLGSVLLIILTVIILFSFLFFNLYNPGRKRPAENQTASSSAGIPFRKDAQLTIHRQHNGPLILDVEIADEEEERMQGLMYRYSMKENQGMFFIFPYEEPRSFWMKNTFISLDIIYINKDYEIISIQKYTQPKSTYSLPSEAPAQFVLEVVAGYADRYGVGPGDRVALQN